MAGEKRDSMLGCQGAAARAACHGLQTPEPLLAAETTFPTLVCICCLLIPEQHYMKCVGQPPWSEKTKKYQTSEQFRSPELLPFLNIDFFWSLLFLFPPPPTWILPTMVQARAGLGKVGCCPSFVLFLSFAFISLKEDAYSVSHKPKHMWVIMCDQLHIIIFDVGL